MAADGGEDGGLDDGELADPDRVPGVIGVELMIGGDGTLCRNWLSWCKRSQNDCEGRIARWGLREPDLNFVSAVSRSLILTVCYLTSTVKF
jgi:hypothetical protein